jgi:branched-subunit amino acid transport protein AzlD
MRMKNNLLSILLTIVPFLAFGQSESADFLRSTGKIYTVIIVVLLIFGGIAFFLYRLDRKLTKLENQIKNEQ